MNIYGAYGSEVGKKPGDEVKGGEESEKQGDDWRRMHRKEANGGV